MSEAMLTQMEILDVLRRLQEWCETQEAGLLAEDREAGEAWRHHSPDPSEYTAPPKYILLAIDDGSGPPLSVDALWLARMRDAVAAADFSTSPSGEQDSE